MMKHFTMNSRASAPLAPTADTTEHYDAYTLECAGRADFYPSWSSNSREHRASDKLKMLKKNIETLQKNLETLE